MSNAILDKIEKLLSLAQSSNKNEADSAYKKAMELMIRHNIDYVSRERTYQVNEFPISRLCPKTQAVALILNNCFFVECVHSRQYDKDQKKIVKTLKINGEKINLEIAVYAWHFLNQELDSLWKREKKQRQLSAIDRKPFFFGIKDGFIQSFKDRQNYVENEKAMILVKDPGLDEFVNQDGRCRNHNVSARRTNGYEHGVEKGKNIQLNRAIETSDGNKGFLLGRK